MATNIVGIAKAIDSDWSETGAYARLWLNPGEDNPAYRSPILVSVEVLRAFRVGIFNVRDNKILPSVGLKRVSPGGHLAPKSRRLL